MEKERRERLRIAIVMPLGLSPFASLIPGLPYLPSAVSIANEIDRHILAFAEQHVDANAA
jgi:hypothetical protein